MTGTFINEDIEAAVARATRAAEGKNVGIPGANLAQQCLERGPLDEIIIHLAPALLGDGVRLSDVPGGLRVRLEPTHVARTGQLTDLRFRVGSGERTAANPAARRTSMGALASDVGRLSRLQSGWDRTALHGRGEK